MSYFFVKNNSVMEITEYVELERGIRPTSARSLYGKMEEVPSFLFVSHGAEYSITRDVESAIMCACNSDVNPFLRQRNALKEKIHQGLESFARILHADYMRFHSDGTYEIHRATVAVTCRGIEHLVNQYRECFGPLIGRWTPAGWDFPEE